MTATPASIVDPNQTQHRQGRLISLAGGLVILFGALWWLQLPSMQPICVLGLQNFIPAATTAGLLMFAVVTALMDLRPGVRWLTVLAVVVAESLNYAAVELVVFADYFGLNPSLLDSVRDDATMHLVMGLGTVLAIHTLLWPFRALLGWQVYWAGDRPFSRKRVLTIWHLAGWILLIPILVIWAGTRMDVAVATLLGGFTTLAAGLPVLVLATRRKHLAFWIPALLAGLIGLSLAELGLTYLTKASFGGSNGISLWYWGVSNATVAGTFLLVALLLRWAGLQFHLPISRPEAALGRVANAGMPANSLSRRDFQFSLRSLLLLTTVLCLGPGAYIAWEREQCRRGEENLYQIDMALGKQSRSQARPGWLQAVLGNNAFRQVRSVHTTRTSFAAADLAPLSGLPNLDTLLLKRTPIDDDGLASLARVKTLQSLELSGTQITDKGLAHLTPLTELRHLIIDNTKVTDAGLIHLSGLSNLRTLLLQDTKITDGGLAHLSPLANLETLFLDNAGVTDAGLVHLTPLAKLSSLTLTNTMVGDAGLIYLPAELKHLGLDKTKVTDTGLVHLSRLTNLRTLRFQETSVTDDGLAHLSPHVSLECLFLSNTEVSDAGLTQLPADLKWLGLANTKVTDAGLVTISRLTKLENLDLSNNSITDAGLAYLEALPILDTLVIKNTQVTKAGAAKLNKKWPALKIQR